MSFTFGFYNSVDEDRLYDALQVSKIFDGIIRDGVYATIGDGFAVRASTEENLVVVGPGRAWFNHTWNENDGYLDLELTPAETILDRIDAVVIDVDNRWSVRTNQILVINGAPSSTPTRPTLTKEIDHSQYPLCYILRKANAAIVNQADITSVIGTSECPFVTGVLETINTDNLFLQWQGEWLNFLEECRVHMDQWTEAYIEDANSYMNEFKLQVEDFKNQMEIWQTEQTEDFNEFYQTFKENAAAYEKEWREWVADLEGILEEDALGALILEIKQLKEDVENQLENTKDYLDELVAGYQPKVTTFPADGSIVETYPDKSTQTTTFLADGNIETTLRSSSGAVVATKLTTFEADGSITEDVVGGSYLEFMLSKSYGVGEYINGAYDLNTPAMNMLDDIRDVARSTVAMDAIANSPEAMDDLWDSKTAMDAFLSSDVALASFAKHEDILKKLFDEQWVVTRMSDVLMSAIAESRSMLKWIFDDPDRQEKYISYGGTAGFLQNSSLTAFYTIADTAKNPMQTNESIPDYTWAVAFMIRSLDRGVNYASNYTVTMTFYPFGGEAGSNKFVFNLADEIPVSNMLLKPQDAFSYCSIAPNRTEGTQVEMQIIAF